MKEKQKNENNEIINYISSENNAKISFCTSENINYKSSNILTSEENNFWLSLSNKPQEIIIDLQNLKKYPPNLYQSFAIYCWHGYDSNPKIVELLINENKEFNSIGIYELELRSGIQVFPIKYNKEIKNVKNIKFIKIIVKENYGKNWTYINQVMLYDKDYNIVNNILKESMTILHKNENNNESNDNDDIEEIEFESEINDKNNNNLLSYSKNSKENMEMNDNISYKSYEFNDNISNNNNNKIEKLDKKEIDENKIQKSKKISRIEKLIKQNIFESENSESIIYQNTSNNIGYKTKQKKKFLDLSENKILTKTPNRYILNKIKDTDNNSNNINIKLEPKKRPYTPNYIHINKNNVPLDSKDYDNILNNKLKDMEEQINILNNINISENNKKIFNKTETSNFYNKISNINTNIFNTKNQSMNKTSYSEFYPNKNNLINNNTINYNDNKIKNNICNEEKDIKDIYKNKRENTIPQCINKNNNFFLNDLSSNNTIDINKRLENLEKDVFNIKQELYSISKIISNITNNNYLRENIKIICDEYLKEKNDNNRSLYSEILTEENKNKNTENELNKIIDKKMNKLNEEIKNNLFNKYIKPALNQIELNMKKNLEDINFKIKEIQINNTNEYSNDYNYNNYNNSINKLSNIKGSSSSKLRNEKYEEINRLGEKLYQKLIEKEKKLEQLKKETSKYFDD